MMILLMVQKSQTITWDQQNPVNNGINDLSLSGFNSPDLLVALNVAGSLGGCGGQSYSFGYDLLGGGQAWE